jgi:hypothetical protein
VVFDVIQFMEDEKLTKADLYRFLFCCILLFFIFVSGVNITAVVAPIIYFLSPDLTNYSYLNPPVFFSIGDALASIAILLAIYQFKKDKWLIALKVRSYIEPAVFTSITIGVGVTIGSSLVLIKNPTNIFQLSIFWQLIGSFLVAFSIVLLFFKATNKNLFNQKTARDFYEVMVWELSRPTPERLDVILMALLDNFENICKAATGDIRKEPAQSAIVVLDVVLGEGTLVDMLTTKRLDALHYILTMLEKYNLCAQRARGFPLVAKNLFIDQSSFLYKHLEVGGLALSSNLYESLFGSPKILGNFDLFGGPTIDYTMKKDLSSKQIEVFIKALSKAIETYLKNGSVPPRHINNGLSHLSEIFGDLCRMIYTEENMGVDTKYKLKDQWWSLHVIANFLGHDYPFLAYKETLNEMVVEREKTAGEADFLSASTINAGVSAAIYKAFVQLSHIKNTNDSHHILIELLHGMSYLEEYKQGYRAPFEKRMWEQIANNVVNRRGASALRTYLASIAFTLASNDVGKSEGWMGEQVERMRRLLFIDLKPLLDKGEKMINNRKMEDVLFPDGMRYQNGKFMYTMGFGKGKTVEIVAPQEGSASALEGVMLNSRSLL